MWLLALAAAALLFLARAWHHGRNWFDQLELDVMCAFGRLWHGCRRVGPCTLPAKGGAILIANHSCHADPAFLIATAPRLLGFLQAKECFEVPLLRHLFKRVGCIPVARDGSDVSAIRQALRRLKQGGVVAIFPEGNLERPDLRVLGPGKPGVAYLALQSRAPVFAAYIADGPKTRDMLKSWLWPSRGVRVVYGPAIDLSAYYGRRPEKALLEEVTGLLMRQIAALKPPPRPPARPVPQEAPEAVPACGLLQSA